MSAGPWEWVTVRSGSGAVGEGVVGVPRKAETSAKAQRDQLRERMRGYGCTVAQIATEMGRRFGLRPRVAWRHAVGWPQWRLAQQYNVLHPGAKLSDHRVSEYETWPHGGCPPSLRYLARLAATFGHGCTPAQLVDADDLEQLIPADRCLLTTGGPPATITTGAAGLVTPPPARRDTHVTMLTGGSPGNELVVPVDPAMWLAVTGLTLADDPDPLLTSCLALVTAGDSEASAAPGGRDHAYHQLVQFFTGWAHTMKRRHMLRILGWAASAATVGHLLEPDEQVRVASVLSDSGRVDARTLDHFEAVLWHCERQDDALGPRGVLDTVLTQRNLLGSLLPGCPAMIRPRLLSVLSGASRQAGWLSFDLNDAHSAGYFYEKARALAHEAENVELGAIILCGMSHSAVWQGTPRIGIDHAVAAQEWANRAGDMRLRAYCADIAAKAYSAAGQREACLTALGAAETMLARTGEQQSGFVYFYGEGAHTLNCGQCHLGLRNAGRAADYARQSLVMLDPSFTRLVAFTSVNLGRAYAQAGEVDESVRLLGNAGEIAARNSSGRLIKILKQSRAELAPWHDSSAVRTLDDRLASYGVT
jgi:tetratricopeptide (TPR) repeat protein